MEDVITDLKQFITAAFSQQFSELREEINQFGARFDKLESRFDDLETKVDGLSAFVSETIDIQSDICEAQFIGHDKRITKLEAKTAS
jgi:uncharacterized coiled-coil protein SlyX